MLLYVNPGVTLLISCRIMVLDSGRIKEFDAPQTLLLNKQSLFYSLAEDAKIVPFYLSGLYGFLCPCQWVIL